MLRGLCAMPVSFWQCDGSRQQRADLVIGVGGYTSPMMVMAAALRGIPVILEPMLIRLANKAVGAFVQRVSWRCFRGRLPNPTRPCRRPPHPARFSDAGCFLFGGEAGGRQHVLVFEEVRGQWSTAQLSKGCRLLKRRSAIT
jgi:hypothetical protein